MAAAYTRMPAGDRLRSGRRLASRPRGPWARVSKAFAGSAPAPDPSALARLVQDASRLQNADF
jgi:hypothetical protein